MKLIKPYFEIIEQQPGEVGMLKHIETCGRVAWKSEERITDDSYVKFVEMLKGVNHGSVLEHGAVYLYLGDSIKNEPVRRAIYDKYSNNKYSKVNKTFPFNQPWDCLQGYITTNYRVLVENNWLDDLKYQCEPTEFHEKRVTVRVVADRGVSHEYVRHRSMSFTQESTRYCNYSKDKFDNQITYIKPPWANTCIPKEGVCIKDGVEAWSNANLLRVYGLDEQSRWFLKNCFESEWCYFNMIKTGMKPQDARAVLPNSLKTELIITGFVSNWKHFFELRTAKGAHPQAQEIAIPLQQEFIKRKLI